MAIFDLSPIAGERFEAFESTEGVDQVATSYCGVRHRSVATGNCDFAHFSDPESPRTVASGTGGTCQV
jgi:hypothetical protein